jgi:predicted permease
MLDSLFRDLRFSARLLAGRPGWTAAAIVCLAIATGANTAAFSLINGLLLRPLPFEESHRLVMVALRDPLKTGTRPFALREYRELSSRSGEVAALLARTFFPLSLSADDGAQMAEAELVSANYFETLRVKPFAGRFFDPNSDRPGGELHAVLSHALWTRRFGADPGIVGRSMQVNGRSALIAGIAPPGFVGAMQLIAADLWLPAAIYPDLTRSADADATPMFGVMGRLNSRVTIDQAEERMTSIAATLPHTVATSGSATTVVLAPATGFGVPVSVHGVIVKLSGFIYVMMALLMAVACANVAALVLARGTGRTREIAVRLSLGASRMQVARQLLTESLMLAVAGSLTGAVAALWATRALVARLTTPFQYVSYAVNVQPDASVFVYCAVVTAGAAVLCGFAPLRHAARIDVAGLLKGSAARGGSQESRRTLTATVVVQFAVSTMLLVAAALVMRAYLGTQPARSIPQTRGLLAATIDADQINLDRAAGVRLYQDVVERLSALPGIRDTALTRDLPLGRGRTVTVTAHTNTIGTPAASVDAVPMVVSPGYFRAVGLAVRQGRTFDGLEPARPRLAVINEQMARRLWPGGSAVGQTFRVSGTNDEPIEVIGIVADVPDATPEDGVPASFYRPFPQEYSARMTVLTRGSGDPGPVSSEVRRTIREVNPDLSIVDLRTVDDLIENADAQTRIPVAVLSLVGSLALLLSAVGLYGVVAYGVRQRAPELGIRLALGARPTDIKRLVLRQGLAIVGTGLAVGIGGAVGVSLVARAALFGLGRLDAPVILIVSAILSATAVAALYLPARWASRVEPAHTLRGD